MASPLVFFGVAVAGAPAELVQKGRRRLITYSSFICLCLLASAAGYQEWIYGGREFDPQARRLHAESGLPVRPIRGLDVDTPMLGATVKNWFTLGLSRAYFESDPFTYRDSQENSWLIAEFDVAAYVRNINAGTQIQNSRWFGYSTINETVFASTLGLLGFSAFLQAAMWLLIALVQYEVPQVIGWKHTPTALRALSFFSAFFTFVGVLVFMTSNVKKDFCAGFDPDNGAYSGGIACQYGSSASAAVSALVFQMFNTAVLIVGISSDLGATYSFKGGFEEAQGSGGGGISSPSFQGSFQGSSDGGGYNTTPIDTDGVSDKPFKSAYQDIGA